MVYLSVLDQSPVRQGGSHAQAVAETLELARVCDALGFHRYWLAEHHNSKALAGTAPEILVARIAGLTENIRVGSGGVMLSHYSPLKVAENFRMLETLFPGRIDLGIGRAPGSDYLTAQALAAGLGALSPEYFSHQVKNLDEYLHDEVPVDHPFEKVHAEPLGDSAPELWLLGSSDQSAMLAAYFGLPFSYAHFINSTGGPAFMTGYRNNYRPSARHPRPRASIGLFVICADSDEEAAFLAESRKSFIVDLRRGAPAPVEAPEAARARDFSRHEQAIIDDALGRAVIGGPATVKREIDRLMLAYQAEEAVIVTITYDFQARKRSYELLAAAFDLG